MGAQKVCHVVGAGDFFGLRRIEPGDIVIAADGGRRYLAQLGITPDLTVGDFDSLRVPPRGEDVILLPEQKDVTDMFAAVRQGMDRGFKSFVLYGATGGRAEHTLANLQLLAMLSKSGMTALMEGERCVYTCITNGKICFDASASGYVSVFSHTDESFGVSISGLKYELSNVTLRNTFALGVSNELCKRPGSISVERGTLTVIFPKGAEPCFQV